MNEEYIDNVKHLIEQKDADCFTTVSQITNNECKELLDKPADVAETLFLNIFSLNIRKQKHSLSQS